MKFLTLSALLAGAMLASPANAQTNEPSQLEHLVAMNLHNYVDGVEASELSNAQLARVYSIMHGHGSESDKRAMIKSAIGGPFSLRGLLFN